MKNKICIGLLSLAFLVSIPTFATIVTPPLIVYSNTHFYQVNPDFNGFKAVSREVYTSTEALTHTPVSGINSIKVPFEQKDRDIYVDDIKVLALPNDPERSLDVHYVVDNIYKIQTPDQRTFYYIQSGLDAAFPNSYGETDDLVEVKDGKVVQSLLVYDYLQYINSNLWRSTECVSGADYYARHQLSLGSKPTDVNLSEKVVKTAIQNKDLFEEDISAARYIGDIGANAIFRVQCSDAKGMVLPLVKFYAVTIDGKVTARPECTKKFTFYSENIFIYNGDILSLEQDDRVLRNLTTKRNLYFEGSAKNLGMFTKTKQTAFKRKLPVYEYRNEKYICLEDLRLLGYAMKWDAKTRIGHWNYTGKKSGNIHEFKSRTIYDNDVYAAINGRYYRIYNAEGYSLIRLDELYGLQEAK